MRTFRYRANDYLARLLSDRRKLRFARTKFRAAAAFMKFAVLLVTSNINFGTASRASRSGDRLLRLCLAPIYHVFKELTGAR